MLRKILVVLAGAVIVMGAVVVWRAASVQPRALDVVAVEGPTIDAEAAVGRLAQAIRYPTISYLETERWRPDPFIDFIEFLAQSFPRTHAALEREIVGGYTLLYRWRGTRQDLEPVLLMGHYDVVAVEPGSEDEWTHPPFAGAVADGYVWGRGALDNKSGVMGILEAVEMLVDEGFAPERTLLLSFGHDEEIGGVGGARRVAEHLAQRHDRLALVLDEGGFIVPDSGVIESPLALVGTGEKGYLNVHLAVRGTGGHSSQPPPETPVGILARAIHRIEQVGFEARLISPTRDMFDRLVPELPMLQRIVFANEWLFRPLIVRQLSADHLTNAMIRTTVAPTMLRGSDKDNVLPIVAEAVLNLRLMPGDTIAGAMAHLARVVDDDRVQMATLGFAIDSSPVSPVDVPAFEALARTIRQIRPDVTVAPYLVIGATDARYFVEIADNVYRFLPFDVPRGDVAGLHGTDERLAVDAYADGIRFYRQLIGNVTGEGSMLR
jgi:carboxypeptidase PM20D1